MQLKCSHCERIFNKTEHLKRHERSHTKEKPFTCPQCHKSYARSDVLARHVRMHSREVKSEEVPVPLLTRSILDPPSGGLDNSSASTQDTPKMGFAHDSAGLRDAQTHVALHGNQNEVHIKDPADSMGDMKPLSSNNGQSAAKFVRNSYDLQPPQIATHTHFSSNFNFDYAGEPFGTGSPNISTEYRPTSSGTAHSNSPMAMGLPSMTSVFPVTGQGQTLDSNPYPSNMPMTPYTAHLQVQSHSQDQAQQQAQARKQPAYRPSALRTTMQQCPPSNVPPNTGETLNTAQNSNNSLHKWLAISSQTNPTLTVLRMGSTPGPVNQYQTINTNSPYSNGSGESAHAQTWSPVHDQAHDLYYQLPQLNQEPRTQVQGRIHLHSLPQLQEIDEAHAQSNSPSGSVPMQGPSGPIANMNYDPNGIRSLKFAKVEQTWFTRLASHSRWPDSEKRWYDVLKGMKGDLFNNVQSTCSYSTVYNPAFVLAPAYRGPRIELVRVSDKCRERMRLAIFPNLANPYNMAAATNPMYSYEPSRDTFPTALEFDAAIALYFEKFSHEGPYFHHPLFSISTCDPLLLFTMACVGFYLMNTHESRKFVEVIFCELRAKIVADLEMKLSASTKDAMSVFAAGALFLKLAALVPEADHLSPCQLMYIALLSLAQLHGMLSEYGKKTSMDLYAGFDDLNEKWAAWGRVESLKRVAIGIMRTDSAYATYLRCAPIIRISSLELLLPCDNLLFAAKTAADWKNLLDTRNLPLIMPAINCSYGIDSLVGRITLDYYSLHTIMNLLQIRSCDAFQKLLDFQHKGAVNFVQIPYQFYALEPSTQTLVQHIVTFMDCHTSLTSNFQVDWQKDNVHIFWHFLCLSMTMNQDMFEIAAGREGNTPAAVAISSIAQWSQTSSARRALVHSAHIYTLLSNNRDRHEQSLYATFATFGAALTMTLWIFAGPVQANTGQPVFELTSDVMWPGFGMTGISDTFVPSSSSPNAQELCSSTASAQHFITHGGPYTFQGRVLKGFPGANVVLNMFADLLDGCSKWGYKRMAKILYDMIHLLSGSV